MGLPNRAEVPWRSIEPVEAPPSNCGLSVSPAPRLLPGTNAPEVTGDDRAPYADRPIIAGGGSPGEALEAGAPGCGEANLWSPVITGDKGIGCIAMAPYTPIRSPEDRLLRAAP